MPSIPQPPDRLFNELIELRPIAEWDIPDVLIAHQDDDDLYRRLGMRKPPTGAQLGSEVENAEADRQAGTRIALTIVEPGGNDCRGRVQVDDVDWEQGSATVKVWAAPQVRGRGYEQHALDLAAAWLFNGVGLQRLQVALDGAPLTTLERSS